MMPLSMAPQSTNVDQVDVHFAERVQLISLVQRKSKQTAGLSI